MTTPRIRPKVSTNAWKTRGRRRGTVGRPSHNKFVRLAPFPAQFPVAELDDKFDRILFIDHEPAL